MKSVAIHYKKKGVILGNIFIYDSQTSPLHSNGVIKKAS